MNETIAAITTAFGPAGVGIVRISGDEAGVIADKVFRAKNGRKLVDRSTYTLTYGFIVDRDGNVIDEALALVMRSPGSYTGEDVVELQCHGGMVAVRTVLDLVLKAGASLAQPGEFSKRAFLHGRLDLAQAEAIMDIIGAKTEYTLRAAAGSLQGGLSKETNEIRDKALQLMAWLEADIDFPEEEIDRLTEEEIQNQLAEIEHEVTRLLATYQTGHILRDGLKTAIIGKPNAGKSSLLNALLQNTRAIVTEIPGTTRDSIEEYYNMGGIPLLLIDTAGIRQTEDVVEKIGVARTREIVETADIILYLLDISSGVTTEDYEYLRELPQEKIIVLINKVDLVDNKLSEQELLSLLSGYDVLFISAKERIGLEQLEEAIIKKFSQDRLDLRNVPNLTNIRQKEALEKARQSLQNALESASNRMPSDFISIDLKQAWLYLGEITGETLGEDMLDQIFSRFCLGK